jgi:uroporphyrinogen-III synthase
MRLFISKSLEELDEIQQFCNFKAWTLDATCLIKTSEVPFTPPSYYDCIFFGSKNGVKHFLNKASILETAKIACAGESTSLYLIELGYKVDFFPSKSGDTTTSSKEFLCFIGDQSAYFPSSRSSAGTYHKLLSRNQKIMQDSYKTEALSVVVYAADLYVFTSPSSWTSFLAANSIVENMRIVAWGKTTAKAIAKAGIKVEHQLQHATISGLLEYLQKVGQSL